MTDTMHRISRAARTMRYGGILAFMLVISISPSFATEATGQWVSFHMATTPPSPFKVRQAKKKGITLSPELGTKIGGTLYLPETDQPTAAVVFIHGCRGVRNFQKDWASLLTKWGYAVLLLDSFGPRNVDANKVCANMHEWDFREERAGRPFDVFGALDFLSKHKRINPEKLAVMGWDGATAMTNIATTGIPKLFDIKLKGAIAMSPDCRQMIEGKVAAPLLILTGSLNDWWPPNRCEKLSQNAKGSGLAPVTHKIYKGAYHSFDDVALGKKVYLKDAFNPFKTPTRGATLGYNEAAHKDAVDQVHNFLKFIFK
jgi:dienelactone hydrolase